MQTRHWKMNNDIFENTVAARGQLKDTEYITYTLKKDARLRVLFVGNSITRHGVKEEIGWNRDCGMAASCLEKDYVHLVVQGLEAKYGPVDFCVVHAAAWEYAFDQDEKVLGQFAGTKDFDADIVILRIGENSDRELLKTHDYYTHYANMAKFFFTPKSKKIVTGLFWRYEPIDLPIERVAKDNGYIYVPIDSFGERDDCKALSEFWHGGVAKHPNDKGMKAIADAILNVL